MGCCCQRFYVDLMQDSAEVTGSFTLGVAKILDKTTKFAVDCGLYQEWGYEEKNESFPTNPEDVEFVILTHNHTDHTGRLPYFVRNGFSGKIYTTEVTKRLLGKALNDSARIIKDTGKRKNKAALYDEDDVQKTLDLVEGCEYNKPIKVNENMTLTFVPNGHLVGAAMVLLQIHCPGVSQDINFFFTGDYNNKNMFFKVAPIRKWITNLPVNILCESTYGYMNSTEIKPVFHKNILNALKQRKTIVILVFSLGRAQEILYLLKVMKEKYPRLFEEVPIYYDGRLSHYYTDMYYHLQEEGLLKFYMDKRDFLPDNLERIDKVMRKNIIEDESNSCKIIVTTSGMGSYGPAQTYLPAFIGKENVLFHFTGYCSENSLGYRLKNTEYGDVVEIAGVKTKKRADVEFTNEFSAHAKADELIYKLLRKFENPQFVMVNHGSRKSEDIFSERILKETRVEYVGIMGRDYFYRFDKDGFVKGMSSKLF